MEPRAIFQPMLALVLLTFVVLLRIPYVRIRAGIHKRVKLSDFALGESAAVPPDVSLPNRNYMNLLELPLLFYALVLALYVTQRVDGLELSLAWLYVALRYAHSAIHLSYNDVQHRLIVFAASNVVLSSMWVVFATRL